MYIEYEGFCQTLGSIGDYEYDHTDTDTKDDCLEWCIDQIQNSPSEGYTACEGSGASPWCKVYKNATITGGTGYTGFHYCWYFPPGKFVKFTLDMISRLSILLISSIL